MKKFAIQNWDGEKVGTLDLPEDIFGVTPRPDIVARVVQWQLAGRRSGNHKTKGVSEISGTTRKPHRQKGTGRARQGSLRSPQFRGGAVIFGPVVRSHAFDLPKKVRRLGLRSVLSSKLQDRKLVVLDSLELGEAKTKFFVGKMDQMGLRSALVVGSASLPDSFCRASKNVHGVNLLPQQGINVYDILRHDVLVLHKDVVPYLGERLV